MAEAGGSAGNVGDRLIVVLTDVDGLIVVGDVVNIRITPVGGTAVSKECL